MCWWVCMAWESFLDKVEWFSGRLVNLLFEVLVNWIIVFRFCVCVSLMINIVVFGFGMILVL